MSYDLMTATPGSPVRPLKAKVTCSFFFLHFMATNHVIGNRKVLPRTEETSAVIRLDWSKLNENIIAMLILLRRSPNIRRCILEFIGVGHNFHFIKTDINTFILKIQSRQDYYYYYFVCVCMSENKAKLLTASASSGSRMVMQSMLIWMVFPAETWGGLSPNTECIEELMHKGKRSGKQSDDKAVESLRYLRRRGTNCSLSGKNSWKYVKIYRWESSIEGFLLNFCVCVCDVTTQTSRIKTVCAYETKKNVK